MDGLDSAAPPGFYTIIRVSIWVYNSSNIYSYIKVSNGAHVKASMPFISFSKIIVILCIGITP